MMNYSYPFIKKKCILLAYLKGRDLRERKKGGRETGETSSICWVALNCCIGQGSTQYTELSLPNISAPKVEKPCSVRPGAVA